MHEKWWNYESIDGALRLRVIKNKFNIFGKHIIYLDLRTARAHMPIWTEQSSKH